MVVTEPRWSRPTFNNALARETFSIATDRSRPCHEGVAGNAVGPNSRTCPDCSRTHPLSKHLEALAFAWFLELLGRVPARITTLLVWSMDLRT